MLVIGPDKPRGPKRHLTNAGVISHPYLPSSAPHGPHRLSHNFTWLAKPAIEKADQSAKLSMPHYTGSIKVWLLAGAVKPNAIFWLVFQNPITFDK